MEVGLPGEENLGPIQVPVFVTEPLTVGFESFDLGGLLQAMRPQ